MTVFAKSTEIFWGLVSLSSRSLLLNLFRLISSAWRLYAKDVFIWILSCCLQETPLLKEILSGMLTLKNNNVRKRQESVLCLFEKTSIQNVFSTKSSWYWSLIWQSQGTDEFRMLRQGCVLLWGQRIRACGNVATNLCSAIVQCSSIGWQTPNRRGSWTAADRFMPCCWATPSAVYDIECYT